MVAPTAKVKSTETTSPKTTSTIITSLSKSSNGEDDVLIEASTIVEKDENDDDVMITEEDTLISDSSKKDEPNSVALDSEGRPKFSSVANSGQRVKFDKRSIRVPPNRLSPLKDMWIKIYEPLVNHLKLQVRMDVRKKEVQIRTCSKTTDPGAVQKGEDFLKAFMVGFDIDDSVALLRLNDLYTETFEVKDVKTLTGDHLSRAIGRIAGKDGKTKYAIENATRTRIVLADSKIHILGGFENVKIARETIVSLILGSPPGKVYGNLRIISSRLRERY